jgi:hypothetical protein
MSKKEYSLYDMNKKILGGIVPVGAKHIDTVKYENLQETISLTYRLLMDIVEVSKVKGDQMSISDARQEALRFLGEVHEVLLDVVAGDDEGC